MFSLNIFLLLFYLSKTRLRLKKTVNVPINKQNALNLTKMSNMLRHVHVRTQWYIVYVHHFQYIAYRTLLISSHVFNRIPLFVVLRPYFSIFRVRWYDTDCNAKSALAAAVDAKSKFDPHLFLGPPCSVGKCTWNLTILVIYCLSNY